MKSISKGKNFTQSLFIVVFLKLISHILFMTSFIASPIAFAQAPDITTSSIIAHGAVTIYANSLPFNPASGVSSNTISIVVAVPLINQSITFIPLSPMVVGGKDQTPVVTSTGFMAVEVISNTPSVCTIDFSKVHGVILVSGSVPENSTLVKLRIPSHATTVKTVFLISAYSSDEETVAGYFIARIAAVESNGASVRRFKEAIEINVPAGAKEGFPYLSYDGIRWHRLLKHESEELSSNLHAGYFVEDDGRIAIISDYLMLFGIRKPQAPLTIISPVEKLSVLA